MCWHPLRFHRNSVPSALGVMTSNRLSRSSLFFASHEGLGMSHRSNASHSTPPHIVAHPETIDIVTPPFSVSCSSLDGRTEKESHSGSSCVRSPLLGTHRSSSSALPFPSSPYAPHSSFSPPCHTEATAAGQGLVGGKTRPLSPPLRPVWWTSCPLHSLSDERRKHFQSLQDLLDGAAALSTCASGADAASCMVSSSSSSPEDGGAGRGRKKCPTRHTAKGEVLVTCRLCIQTPKDVLCHRRGEREKSEAPSSLSFSSAFPFCPSSQAFNAVNYALHRRLHPPPTRPFKGILKGCAEQNALGAVAAAGYNYVHHVQAMYLLAEYWMENGEEEEEAMSRTAEAPLPQASAPSLGTERAHPTTLRRRTHFPFPCAECWRYLTEIGRLKHQLGLPPLELWIQVPHEGAEKPPMEEEGRGEMSCAMSCDASGCSASNDGQDGKERNACGSSLTKGGGRGGTMTPSTPWESSLFSSTGRADRGMMSGALVTEIQGIALCFVSMDKHWQISSSLSSLLRSVSPPLTPSKSKKKKEKKC